MKEAYKKRTYLDHAAATLQEKRVRSLIQKVDEEIFGNPGSLHYEGVLAKKKLDQSREGVAHILHAHPDEIVFTSGGTESNNLALFGSISDIQKSHIIVSNIEHPSVLECAHELERRGAEISFLPVEENGIVSVQKIKKLLRENTVLVSVMYANNEIGSIQPISEIAKIIRQHNKAGGQTIFHTDACQATNYLDMNVSKLGVDLMTFSASKIYGPKSVGALFVKRGTKLSRQSFGGGQEKGLRSGTENVSAIAGFLEALYITEEVRVKESERLRILRDFFVAEVLIKIPDTMVNGSMVDRLPNNANISFLGYDGEEIVISLDARGISASTGSACANIEKKGGKVSNTVLYLNNDRIRAMGSVRFTFGRDTKKADMVRTVKELCDIMKKLSKSK
jgi:cysteine desulfurase